MINQIKKHALVIVATAAILGLLALLAAVPSVEDAAAQTAATPVASPTPDNSWLRIAGEGTIVVGTSAPYEPFAYRTGLFRRLDGYDIAVMEEIGNRLGLEVQFKDYAFDGLFGALRLNRIDAAIAAITVTSERAALVDFSDVYYQSQGGVLASADTDIDSLTDADIALLRVGVERGSVYETWLYQQFVLTGRMRPANLFTYQDVDEVIEDLEDERIDLAMMDLPVAQGYVRAGGVVLVGESNGPPQNFAIALPKGATSLQIQIDAALQLMLEDGTLDEIAVAYGLTPYRPSQDCINDLTYIDDVTYADQNMAAPPSVPANQPIIKTWLVENSGTCTWDTSYRLIYAYGNSPYAQMSGHPTYLSAEVPPGAQAEVSVELITPPYAGVYQGVWQMEDGQRVAFGEKLSVGLSVPAAPAPTPAPTQTPAPGINFSVDRTNIREGECVTFVWDVENVREVYFYVDGTSWENHGVAGQGSSVQCPSVTTTYNLRVVKTDGSVDVRQITIFVEVTASAPNIERFTAAPSQITVGQCVNLDWRVSGDVNRVNILANNRAIWDGAPIKGNMNDCPPGAGNVVYAVEASGNGGTSRREVGVRVNQPGPDPTATPLPPTPEPATPTPLPPTPTSTPVPDAPVISSFNADPSEIDLGACVDLSWSFSGQDLAQAQVTANGAVIVQDAALDGGTTDCPSVPGEVIYSLTVTAEFGGQARAEARVTVNPKPQPEP